MAAAEVADTAVVLHSSQCSGPGACPFCFLNLPHSSSTAIVVRRCEETTQRTREELRSCILNYAVQVSAMRKILEGQEPTARLPVALTFSDLFEGSFAGEYDRWMGPQGDPPATSTRPHDMRGNPTSSTTAAPGPTAWSSWDFGKDWTQIPATDEYPQWEVQTGKKKKKWTPYTRDLGEALETAHLQNTTTFQMFIDDDRYIVDLVNMTQTNQLTQTVRRVRRLRARSDTDD